MKSVMNLRMVAALAWCAVVAAPAALAESGDEYYHLDIETQKAIAKSKEEGKETAWYTPQYTFINVSANYLDWSSATERKSGKADFFYTEIEGGAGWDWGEFYGFFDVENPTKGWHRDPPDDIRLVAKPILDIKLGDSGFYYHLQDYYLKSDTFYVNNLVFPGVAYKLKTDFGLWVRPFIGGHYQNSTFYSGWNGYKAGWVFAWDFDIAGQKFALSNWHEFEFDRDKEHYQLDDGTPTGDGKSWGLDGALALWWHLNKTITTGVQWRYSKYKLGYAGYQQGFIYTLKYNF